MKTAVTIAIVEDNAVLLEQLCQNLAAFDQLGRMTVMPRFQWLLETIKAIGAKLVVLDNVAHFFAEKSTSTFVITREGNKVIASIYDRNIEANEETKEPLDKIRNAVVGLGAKHGLSKVQWQALADALVKND